MQIQMKDLAITLEDRPGTLAKATEAIAKAGINIEGLAAAPCEGTATLHVLTSNANGTRRALESEGFAVETEQPVLVVDVDDRTGAAAEMFRKLADESVNVTLVYLATNTRAVIGASDLEKVARILAKQSTAATRR